MEHYKHCRYEYEKFFEHYGKCTDEDLQAMYNEVKNSAYEIIQKKRCNLLRNSDSSCNCRMYFGGENSVLTISSVLNGEYGKDISLSVPTQVSGYGVERILDVPLTKPNFKALEAVPKHLKTVLNQSVLNHK